jgi:hypothetical protein
LVGGEVQLDEGYAATHRGQLVSTDTGACQDQQLETSWILDELTDLQLFVKAVPHAVIKTPFIAKQHPTHAVEHGSSLSYSRVGKLITHGV